MALLAFPLLILVAHLAMFAVARLALFLVWREFFPELDGSELAASFLHGLRFDLSIACTLLAPALLALCLPFAWARSKPWRGGWSWYAFSVLAILSAVAVGDICYFGLVRRHVGLELFAIGDELGDLTEMAVDDYGLASLCVLGFLGAAGWAWHVGARRFAAPGARRGSWLVACLMLVATFLAVRGKLSGKPIGMVDAFRAGCLQSGQLAMNGPFSALHSWLNMRHVDTSFLPEADALAVARADFVAPSERLVAGGGPLERARVAPIRADDVVPDNVVIVLLEGWDAMAIDAIRREHGEPPLGLTPSFDRLAESGALFPRCYAAGQRTMDGFAAILCGIPTLPGFSYVGHGMEQNRLTFLAELARDEGYATLFVQGSKRNSFRRDALAPRAGFERFVGMEDIVAQHGVEPMDEWGVWDEHAFDQFVDEAARTSEPFLGLMFTTSTHTPFDVPDARFERLPPDSKRNRAWNSIHYADWALGRFFERLRPQPWFDRTLFVVLADHTSGSADKGGDARALHHVPLLLLGPGIAAGIDRRVASQLDVLPTIVEIAGWRRPYAALGRSLLDPRPDRSALCIRGNLAMRVEPCGYVIHDLKRRVEASLDGACDPAEVERRLLATLQIAMGSLRRNAWAREPTLDDDRLRAAIPARATTMTPR